MSTLTGHFSNKILIFYDEEFLVSLSKASVLKFLLLYTAITKAELEHEVLG